MTWEQLDAELQKGFDSMKGGKAYAEAEVDAMFADVEHIISEGIGGGNPAA